MYMQKLVTAGGQVQCSFGSCGELPKVSCMNYGESCNHMSSKKEMWLCFRPPKFQITNTYENE